MHSPNKDFVFQFNTIIETPLVLMLYNIFSYYMISQLICTLLTAAEVYYTFTVTNFVTIIVYLTHNTLIYNAHMHGNGLNLKCIRLTKAIEVESNLSMRWTNKADI